ncbi:PrsW family glutamic-type intramembrane protease [Streptococcus massiliensis]|uniref:Repair protein n=1 Tax=Streptococcus massiliensis TaxID=313439 RepID=A0A380KYH0_9STRE|nr:PrsW family glutamic-type intramembrane protease [Streptococcus massiliensis]SUN76675.1 repair protein [Streptococcus massiliensis]
MKKKLIFFAFWLMVCIGLEQEFYTYTSDHMTGTEYDIALYCSLLLLLYIVPAAFALRYLQKKWNLQPRLIWLSLTAGAFISGWLAAYGNDGVDWFLDLFIKNKEIFDTLGALSAPIIEEPIKLFAAFMTLLLLGTWKPRQVLTAGIGAGLGFQIIEDFAYINSNVSEGLTYSVADIFGRMTGAIASHWLYSALVVFGLYLLTARNLEKSTKKLGRILFMAGFILHFLWNSPLIDLKTPLPLVGPILSAAGLCLFSLAYEKAETIKD